MQDALEEVLHIPVVAERVLLHAGREHAAVVRLVCRQWRAESDRLHDKPGSTTYQHWFVGRDDPVLIELLKTAGAYRLVAKCQAHVVRENTGGGIMQMAVRGNVDHYMTGTPNFFRHT